MGLDTLFFNGKSWSRDTDWSLYLSEPQRLFSLKLYSSW